MSGQLAQQTTGFPLVTDDMDRLGQVESRCEEAVSQQLWEYIRYSNSEPHGRTCRPALQCVDEFLADWENLFRVAVDNTAAIGENELPPDTPEQLVS